VITISKKGQVLGGRSFFPDRERRKEVVTSLRKKKKSKREKEKEKKNSKK